MLPTNSSEASRPKVSRVRSSSYRVFGLAQVLNRLASRADLWAQAISRDSNSWRAVSLCMPSSGQAPSMV